MGPRAASNPSRRRRLRHSERARYSGLFRFCTSPSRRSIDGEQLFFDAELQKGIFLKELHFPQWEVLESKDTEKEITRVVKAQPKLDAPAAVQKLPVIRMISINYMETIRDMLQQQTDLSKVWADDISSRSTTVFKTRLDTLAAQGGWTPTT